MKIEFYRHQLGEEEASSWRRALETLFLTLGPQVAAFEDELGKFLVRGRESTQAPHVVGTSSCSMGLLLALRALDVGPGDEVITTPMTFASTTNAILHLGASPRLVDVEAATGLIDPAAVAAAVGPRTVGILPVHLYGQLADMRALRATADAHGLFIVEDSAHGIEMERDGVRPGDLGDAAVFSFYATKNITSGDGGAVSTRDARVAERLRRLRNHGVSKAATERHGAGYQHWDLVELGYKANLTDLDAAMLRPQLERVEDKRRQREQITLRYESLLRERVPEMALAGRCRVPWMVERRGQSSHHLFTIHALPGDRDALLAKLGAAGVGTAVNYRAIHLLTYLVETLALPRGSLPVAEEMGDRTISLPMYPTLESESQDRVVEAVAAAWGRSVSLRHQIDQCLEHRGLGRGRRVVHVAREQGKRACVKQGDGPQVAVGALAGEGGIQPCDRCERRCIRDDVAVAGLGDALDVAVVDAAQVRGHRRWLGASREVIEMSRDVQGVGFARRPRGDRHAYDLRALIAGAHVAECEVPAFELPACVPARRLEHVRGCRRRVEGDDHVVKRNASRGGDERLHRANADVDGGFRPRRDHLERYHRRPQALLRLLPGVLLGVAEEEHSSQRTRAQQRQRLRYGSCSA